ncbi:cyclin-dependent kinase inhibitor 3-like isoform X2 [Carassius auratus]|uniref:protein-tyrosine-phosphatase n=1 Tax=Carassius auratus TaxID=7957 RepID=A0A6P6QJX5_CARAU|nr:cyclin-dependent kinase inhibitor 3-like isoform X2 [Carassius auratus]
MRSAEWCVLTGAMRTSEFDSSDEEDFGEEEATPFQISWLSLSVVECSQSLGICSLPGCRYKDIRRNLQKDVAEMCDQGVEDVFVFCTRGELVRYRVPCLLEVYSQNGLRVHHVPFPDGCAPELPQCCCILEELQDCLQNQRKTVIHSYGGLGRSGLTLCRHDAQRCSRDPEGAERGRSHSDHQAVQLPS